jgi:alpha-1,2-mannosyltransferase
LGYGQVNLLITLLIVGDLSRHDAANSKGAMIGLAAGLKLTPLIFIPYLFCSRRRRAALVALGTFASTVVLGYALLPDAATRFWGGLFLDSRRVGGAFIPGNQSLRGLILRLDPSFSSGAVVAIAVIVGLVGVALAVLANRRSDEAIGFSLCALTGLLVSPVSWTHHWTLAVPALLLLGIRVVRRRPRVGIAAVAVVLLVGYSYLPKLMAKPALAPSRGLSVWWTLASAPYVLIGLSALAFAAARETRRVPGEWHSRHTTQLWRIEIDADVWRLGTSPTPVQSLPARPSDDLAARTPCLRRSLPSRSRTQR